MISFLLDEELYELSDVPPDLTVLDWLRIHKRRTGTKEGCGSGDCGACTVVLASAEKGDAGSYELIYRSINSCITFIGALHGKQLLTVESLANDGTLHPVQQCMVEEHGSQCGFCTPGFIMSMYALYQQPENESVLNERIEQALGGNLCRCTGYRPIKQAMKSALAIRTNLGTVSIELSNENDAGQRNTLAENVMADNAGESIVAATAATAASIKTEVINTLRNIGQSEAQIEGFYQPDNLASLSHYIQENPDARILAGGTDMALEVTQQLRELPSIVSITAVPELQEVIVNDKEIELGAGVTLTECLAQLQSRIPGAKELLLRFGSDQVRNQGTLGGNIGSASPIGDLPPLLMALNATLTLQSGNKTRTLALEDHFLAYRKTSLQQGEFIRSVKLSLPSQSSICSVHKISKRSEDDISSVCMAVHLPMSDGVVKDCRIAFGGMAAIPIRALKAEQALNDRGFTQASVDAAKAAFQQELSPISDARASADYRMQIAVNLLQRVLNEVVDS